MDSVARRSEVASSSQIEVLSDDAPTGSAPVLRLRLKKPKENRNVNWTSDTVDNENMGKKKSKCCCIYKKPLAFGESSSEDDEECEHCFGHPEKKRRNKKQKNQQNCDHNHLHDSKDQNESQNAGNDIDQNKPLNSVLDNQQHSEMQENSNQYKYEDFSVSRMAEEKNHFGGK